MKLQSLLVRTSLLLSAAVLTSCYFVPMTSAQQEPDADSDTATFPAAKRRAAQPTPVADTSGENTKALEPEKDGDDAIRKREQWFYKPRASARAHVPAGARLRALQHMRRMMSAEGKLVQRPDGSFAEVAPQFGVAPLATVTNTWASIGPTPTTGGFFSPVTGRITAIAVDPSNTTGNTGLIVG